MLRFSRIATFAAILATAGTAGAQNPDADPTAALLRELIRVNTSNPPGNERGSPTSSRRASRRSASRSRSSRRRTRARRTSSRGCGRRLEAAGPARRACRRRRRRAREVDASIRSPAMVKDGHVYGRGAIDFKGGMAVFARAVMMLAEHKVPLPRRDLPRRSRRRGRAVQHVVAGARALGRRSTASSRSTKAAGS